MRGLQSWTSGCEGSGRPSRTSGQTVNKTCTCDNCAALRRKRREHRMRAMRRRTGASLADQVMYADGSVPTMTQTSFCAFTRCPFLQTSLLVGAAMLASAISAPRIHCQCSPNQLHAHTWCHAEVCHTAIKMRQSRPSADASIAIATRV